MKPLTWQWTAGFFQAEGSPIIEATHPKLTFTQTLQNSQVLVDVQALVKTTTGHSPPLNTCGEEHSNNSNDAPSRKLSINIPEVVTQVVTEMLPYLRSKKYQQVVDCMLTFGLPLPQTPSQPIDWEFLTGFWEGDGDAQNYQAGSHGITNYCIGFRQDSDLLLLDEIHTFFGKGTYLCPAHLRVYDSRREDLPIHRKLLEHVRMSYRRQQLIKQLLLFERERDNLNDTRTIVRYRELITT